MPVISILLPLFNAAPTLPAALRSIRRQSLTDWECIVVDDGSTDGGAEIVEDFGAGDPRFVLLRTDHGGIVAALNRGIERCRAPLVARMDADDIMSRERLARQAAMLHAEPRLAAVGCHVRLFPRRQLGKGWRDYERWLNRIVSPEQLRRESLIECPIGHPTWMIRREVLAHFRYRDCGWAEDYDLLLRLLAEGREIGVVPRRLLSWRDSPERLSRRDPRCSIDSFVRCKAQFLAEGFLREARQFGLWGYGATGRQLHRALREHGRELAFVIDVHPGRLGQRILSAPVVAPDEYGFPAGGAPLIVSVAHERPRQEIREFLARRGLQELRDFVCAA